MSGATPPATPPRSPNSQEDDKDLAGTETELAKEDEDVSARATAIDLHRNNLPDLFRPGVGEPNIIPESVHYVGYFSNHEQSMQTVVQVCFRTSFEKIVFFNDFFNAQNSYEL
jgi:hypothetical protein